MSLTAIFILDFIMLTAIGFFVWSYCRGTRISTLEMVASYKLNLRDTESKIQLAVEERIARVDLNEKRLNHVESRVAKVANRVERDRAMYKETGKTRAKRLWKRDRERRRQMIGPLGTLSREAFERHLADERAKLYTKPVGA